MSSINGLYKDFVGFEQVWGHLGVPLGAGFETILGLYGSIFEPCLGGPGNAWMSSIKRAI